LRYSERFVFVLEDVWEKHWKDFYLDLVQHWQKAIADLPPAVVHALAHGNADRLWKIPPKIKNK